MKKKSILQIYKFQYKLNLPNNSKFNFEKINDLQENLLPRKQILKPRCEFFQ